MQKLVARNSSCTTYTLLEPGDTKRLANRLQGPLRSYYEDSLGICGSHEFPDPYVLS